MAYPDFFLIDAYISLGLVVAVVLALTDENVKSIPKIIFYFFSNYL